MAPKKASKKIKSAKAKKPNTALQHPKVSDMVNTAISTLKERGGSSTQAIKKYVGMHYKVNAEKFSPFIKKYLKNSVISGTLIQTRGRGASGSFKLASHTKEIPSRNKSVVPNPKAIKGATTKMQLPTKDSVTKNSKSKEPQKPKKSKTIKPTATKSKKVSAVMRVDGSRAPSRYAIENCYYK